MSEKLNREIISPSTVLFFVIATFSQFKNEMFIVPFMCIYDING